MDQGAAISGKKVNGWSTFTDALFDPWRRNLILISTYLCIKSISWISTLSKRSSPLGESWSSWQAAVEHILDCPLLSVLQPGSILPLVSLQGKRPARVLPSSPVHMCCHANHDWRDNTCAQRYYKTIFYLVETSALDVTLSSEYDLTPLGLHSIYTNQVLRTNFTIIVEKLAPESEVIREVALNRPAAWGGFTQPPPPPVIGRKQIVVGW